jgi:16S rRNA (adenine1518-N6/adenine1519-N6)-dimethyltransferase
VSHRPRKRFGQNFLRDEAVVFNIVAAMGLCADDHGVEIGPGQGALTRLLLAECRRLDVVELDRDLVELLMRKFAGNQNLRVHSGDALRFDFCSLSEGEKLRIVGNLPYNISTPLLFRLFEQAACIKDMYFMLQKEVVDRLCAQPGEKHYGRLSIMAQYYCRMDRLMEVYPESFFPKPKVMSSVVRLVPHAERPVDISPEILSRVVVEAFSQRRKTLRNSLGSLFSEEQIRHAGLDPNTRAEMLDLYDYARLVRLYLKDTTDT